MILNAPAVFDDLLGPLPSDVEITALDSGQKATYIHLFTQEMAELEVLFPRLKAQLMPGGGIWISWPKGSSVLEKDLNGNDVRRVGLANGLVDVKVCAINQDWSGLKFMFRTKSKPISS